VSLAESAEDVVRPVRRGEGARHAGLIGHSDVGGQAVVVEVEEVAPKILSGALTALLPRNARGPECAR
jgi:hypothetical protein